MSSAIITTAFFGQNRHPRSERKCELCNLQEIEDEFHFFYNLQLLYCIT
jgi:hypothetical protein